MIQMAYKELRKKASILRAEEKSYSQISSILGISKSTLSGWLSATPLSSKRINELRGRNPQRIKLFQESMRKKREARFANAKDEQKKVLFPLSDRDILIAGYILYWGEGLKSSVSEVGVANTDPAIIRLFIVWMEKVFGISRKEMHVRVHFYSDMDVDKETLYWMKITGIPRKNFRKPYIKASTRAGITYKGMHGHGTCNVGIGDARLRERVIGAINLLQENFTEDL